ncbi:MAG: cyclopropane-fatty-acyl-phospholipid synthase family protein [Rhodothermia bacterium]|nr:MAG: cyclopropane-fatty-acyl-phospholipid synthase family protein [Rhodothermia bacterium]
MLLLNLFLKKLINSGHLTVIASSGRQYVYGDNSGPNATIRLHTRYLAWRLALFPELALGEAYMDGTLTIESGSLHEFIDLVTGNIGWKPDNRLNANNARLKRLKNYYRQINTRERSKKLVAHHYDIKADVYASFLDSDLQYTCAYFTNENVEMDLDRAQRDKTALIAKKLLARPEHKILDIGCGWGGPAIHMQRLTGSHVTGITLSNEQLASANARAEQEGVSGEVEFRLQDYRDVPDKFDRITVVGMLEHVGLPQYKTFFKKLYQILEDDGIALLHTIGRADGPGITDAWTAKYIFANSYAPSLSEIVRAVEQTGFYITDVEVLRTHYAKTLSEWSRRFDSVRDQIIAEYDESFFRMFEYYLKISEFAFRNIGHVIFQIQLAKKQDTVPVTRDYLANPLQ